jgi:DNA-binding IclR family transcriptional regulator
VDGGKDIRRVLSVGKRGAIYAGSPSKVLLAFLPDEKIIEILKPIKMTKITDLTKTTIEDIMQDLLKVRQNGYSITKGEETEHSFAVSTPIRDYTGNVISTVSIVGITIYLTKKLEKEYIELAKQLAADISYDMGYLNSSQ